MTCPQCGSERVVLAGKRYVDGFEPIQRCQCKVCGSRFSEAKRYKMSTTKEGSVQVCVSTKGAKNLTEATINKIVAGEEKQTIKGKLLQFTFHLNKEGKSKGTISTYSSLLKRLSRHCDMEDPETVKVYLSKTSIAINTKACYRVAYTAFLTWQGKTWKPPKYTARSPIPEFLPTEQEIDQLISGTGKKTATILQTIKETGMRIG